MLFNSLDFLIFFLVVYSLYLLLPHRGQNILLLIASYFFYGCWDYRFLVLLILLTTVDFMVAQQISRTSSDKHRNWLLTVSLCTGLGVLGFFKYFNFFLDGADTLLQAMGLDAVDWRLKIVLPVGISFYVFKSLSYTLDVHGRQMEPTRHWADYATFVAFFPQLLSGPIDRAAALLPQIQRPRMFTTENLRVGIWLFLWGLFKKIVVADNIAASIAPLVSEGGSTAAAWISFYAYAWQLYCDFSGYTDMARGVAQIFGFDTAHNFRSPFLATNPVDFWKRWHISLSQWVQDYLYFPLAAHFMRKSNTLWSQHKTHLIAMTLIGLWHGASMCFVVFGIYWGMTIVLYNLYRRWSSRRARAAGRRGPITAPAPLLSWRRLLSMIAFFHITCLALVLFRSATLADAAHFVGRLLSFQDGVWIFGGVDREVLNALLLLVLMAVPLVAVQFLEEATQDPLALMRLSLVPRVAIYSTVVLLLILLGNTGGRAFIYFQF